MGSRAMRLLSRLNKPGIIDAVRPLLIRRHRERLDGGAVELIGMFEDSAGHYFVLVIRFVDEIGRRRRPLYVRVRESETGKLRATAGVEPNWREYIDDAWFGERPDAYARLRDFAIRRGLKAREPWQI
jgi:hypothetical protein